MTTEELLQQRIYLIESLPEHQVFHVKSDFIDSLLIGNQSCEEALNPVYLNMVKWG
jgi:hypothetical protein